MDKGVLLIGGITLAVVAILIGVAMSNPNAKLAGSFEGEENDIVSQEGVHWHTQLDIYINGVKQPVQENLGLGDTYINNRYYDSFTKMASVHTHDETGKLHWEIADGPVKKGHLKLAALFELWNKPFTKEQIFDAKNADGKAVKMIVNGETNMDFENYVVKDGDMIEIRYE